MTDQILALVPTYGLSLLVVIVFLSCLALPVPSSMVMLTSGSFAGTGDLDMTATFLAALGAAVAGDQVGFLIGRKGGAPLLMRLASTPDRKALLKRAEELINKRAGVGVFFSRWLISPLGPYVNFIGGATGLNWVRFSLFGVAGEAVWVSGYVGLGVAFSDNIAAAAELASDLSGVLAGGAVTLFIGWRLWIVVRNARKELKDSR